MGMTENIFNAAYAGIPAAQASVRAGRETIARCLCSGLMASSEPTEQGLMLAADVSVRLLLANEPTDGQLANNQKITVTMTESGASATMRITARNISGGILRLTLEGVTQ